MTAPSSAPRPSVAPNWKEAAQKFRNANGYGLSYTIDFNDSINALICDPEVSPFVRVLAWMKHGAWGNYSPFVTDKIGGTHPRTWADCARDTGLSKQRVSEVSAFYLAHGYACWEKGIIYPEPSPTPILAGELSGSLDSSSLNFHHNTSGYKVFSVNGWQIIQPKPWQSQRPAQSCGRCACACSPTTGRSRKASKRMRTKWTMAVRTLRTPRPTLVRTPRRIWHRLPGPRKGLTCLKSTKALRA